MRGEVLSLTRKETGILEYLLLHQGRPVSQEELLEHVWDSGADGTVRLVTLPRDGKES